MLVVTHSMPLFGILRVLFNSGSGTCSYRLLHVWLYRGMCNSLPVCL